MSTNSGRRPSIVYSVPLHQILVLDVFRLICGRRQNSNRRHLRVGVGVHVATGRRGYAAVGVASAVQTPRRVVVRVAGGVDDRHARHDRHARRYRHARCYRGASIRRPADFVIGARHFTRTRRRLENSGDLRIYGFFAVGRHRHRTVETSDFRQSQEVLG